MIREQISSSQSKDKEPRGFLEKYWIGTTKKRLVKISNDIYPDQDIIEYLASKILKLLNVDTVDVSLGITSTSQKCCIVDSFLTKIGDESYNVDFNWPSINFGDDYIRNISICFSKVFNQLRSSDISNEDFEKIKKDYVRVIFSDCILKNEDGKLSNHQIIANQFNKKLKLSPSYDNGLSFFTYNFEDIYSECYVGNVRFPTNEIVEFICKYFFDYVVDIINKVPNLLLNLEEIFFEIDDELSFEKKEYIRNYIINICSLINENCYSEKTKK